MKRFHWLRPQISLRSSLIALMVVGFILGWIGNRLRLKQRERAAANHLVGRHHGAPMTGPATPWPISSVLGDDFAQHVRSIQMWNFQPDSVACALDLPYLEEVHIDEDEVFKSGKLTEKHFSSLRGHQRIRDLYINAPFDDSLLSHFRAPHIRRLVLYQTRMTGSGLRLLSPKQLETLTLFRSPINDVGMSELTRFDKLQNLLIQGTDITDQGMHHLKKLKKLHALVLIDLDLTDRGLEHLPPDLDRLFVRDIPITDAAVKHLARTNLRHVHFINTKVTPDGIKRLQELMPSCKYRLKPNQDVERTAPTMSYDTVFFAHPGTEERSFDIQRHSSED